MRAIHLRYAAYGLVFGFMLSRMGFSNFDEVHRMFVFEDLRLFLTFCAGVVLSMVGFFLFARAHEMPKRLIHKGSVLGGLMFGAGWAVTGACPAILLVQIGEGQISGLTTLVGALTGMFIYPALQRRLFRWDTGSCS